MLLRFTITYCKIRSFVILNEVKDLNFLKRARCFAGLRITIIRRISFQWLLVKIMNSLVERARLPPQSAPHRLESLCHQISKTFQARRYKQNFQLGI
jgi:hypothetical protein